MSSGNATHAHPAHSAGTRRAGHPPFLLRGLVSHSLCGKRMKATTDRNSHCRYYECGVSTCGNTRIDAVPLERAVWGRIWRLDPAAACHRAGRRRLLRRLVREISVGAS